MYIGGGESVSFLLADYMLVFAVAVLAHHKPFTNIEGTVFSLQFLFYGNIVIFR